MRGLDYYERTVFEVTSTRLGAQDAILGGGRYDGLVEALGGPSVPGFGFAVGVERLLMLMPDDAVAAAAPDVAVVPLGTFDAAAPLAEQLRDSGLSVLLPLADRKMNAQMKRATKRGARFALFVGESELAAGRFGLKNLESGDQVEATIEEAVRAIGADSGEPTR